MKQMMLLLLRFCFTVVCIQAIQRTTGISTCGLGLWCGPCCCIAELQLIDCLYSNQISVFPQKEFSTPTPANDYISIDFVTHCPLTIDVRRFQSVLPNIQYLDFAKRCHSKCVTLINKLKPDQWKFGGIECIIQFNGTEHATTERK